jgi:hypothetical protein
MHSRSGAFLTRGPTNHQHLRSSIAKALDTLPLFDPSHHGLPADLSIARILHVQCITSNSSSRKQALPFTHATHHCTNNRIKGGFSRGCRTTEWGLRWICRNANIINPCGRLVAVSTHEIRNPCGRQTILVLIEQLGNDDGLVRRIIESEVL